MSTSGKTIAVGQPRRVSRIWLVIGAVVLAPVALVATVFTGTWVANQLADADTGTPAVVTTSTTIR
jgi:hypothetical protein